MHAPAKNGADKRAPEPAAGRRVVFQGPAEHAAPAATRAPPRKLQVLCPACLRHDVHLVDGVAECRACSRAYANMLDLIPVKAVGPFSFLFGEGARGVATAAGVLVAVLLLYGVFRWL